MQRVATIGSYMNPLEFDNKLKSYDWYPVELQ